MAAWRDTARAKVTRVWEQWMNDAAFAQEMRNVMGVPLP